MKKLGMIFCLVLVFSYSACIKSHEFKVHRLIFEEYDFKYDSIGRLDSSRKNEVTVYLSKDKIRRDCMQDDKNEGRFRETKIQSLSGKDSFCLMVFKDFKEINYSYCVKQYYYRHWQKIPWMFYIMKKIQVDCSINGYTCDKYELEYHGHDSDPDHRFHLYFTNEIKVKDETGSYFLFPRFYPECWENSMSMDTINKFLVRADCLNDQGQIAHTFRLKSLEKNIEDKGYFQPPGSYPVYAHDSIPKKIWREKVLQD